MIKTGLWVRLPWDAVGINVVITEPIRTLVHKTKEIFLIKLFSVPFSLNLARPCFNLLFYVFLSNVGIDMKSFEFAPGKFAN